MYIPILFVDEVTKRIINNICNNKVIYTLPYCSIPIILIMRTVLLYYILLLLNRTLLYSWKVSYNNLHNNNNKFNNYYRTKSKLLSLYAVENDYNSTSNNDNDGIFDVPSKSTRDDFMDDNYKVTRKSPSAVINPSNRLTVISNDNNNDYVSYPIEKINKRWDPSYLPNKMIVTKCPRIGSVSIDQRCDSNDGNNLRLSGQRVNITALGATDDEVRIKNPSNFHSTERTSSASVETITIDLSHERKSNDSVSNRNTQLLDNSSGGSITAFPAVRSSGVLQQYNPSLHYGSSANTGIYHNSKHAFDHSMTREYRSVSEAEGHKLVKALQSIDSMDVISKDEIDCKIRRKREEIAKEEQLKRRLDSKWHDDDFTTQRRQFRRERLAYLEGEADRQRSRIRSKINWTKIRNSGCELHDLLQRYHVTTMLPKLIGMARRRKQRKLNQSPQDFIGEIYPPASYSAAQESAPTPIPTWNDKGNSNSTNGRFVADIIAKGRRKTPYDTLHISKRRNYVNTQSKDAAVRRVKREGGIGYWLETVQDKESSGLNREECESSNRNDSNMDISNHKEISTYKRWTPPGSVNLTRRLVRRGDHYEYTN